MNDSFTRPQSVERFRPAPARVSGASVTFGPDARTAWHTHPLGQTLIVVSGCGRAQREGGPPIEEIRPGDLFWQTACSIVFGFCRNLQGDSFGVR
jgi:quercetin dioxygenase-like cupin family protein